MTDSAEAASKATARLKGSSIAACGGEAAFQILGLDSAETKVPIAFSRQEDAKSCIALIESPAFCAWAANYESNPSFALTQVNVKSLHLTTEGEVSSAIIEPIVETADGTPVPVAEPILLRGNNPTVGVLVMFRCNFTRPSPPGTYNREFVLFSSPTRLSLGEKANLEILTGTFGGEDDEEFISPAASELISILNININRKDLVSLNRTRPIASAPEQLHENIQLYLYRLTITEPELQQLPKGLVKDANAAGETPAPTSDLRLTPLAEAWKVTSDAKSMAALFLFHEFRYHGIMPKYRHPGGSKQAAIEKKKPTYISVDNLDPSATGINLKVKIVQPTVVEPTEGNRREGSRGRDARIVVGDGSAFISMRLDGDQLQLPGLTEVGTCLIIRNAQIEVINSFMVLAVDKWGKIAIPETDDELEGYDFEVDDKVDKSSVPYELVPEENAEEGYPQGNMEGRGRARGRGRGRRGWGRGRGTRGSRG